MLGLESLRVLTAGMCTDTRNEMSTVVSHKHWPEINPQLTPWKVYLWCCV